MGYANRNISLRAMRIFCAAAERESFREAAEALFLTASAVSHQVKQLENELRTKLFERGARSLQLTADGHALYDDIHPLISGFDSVVNKFAGSRKGRSLRISVQPFFASELFVPRLPEFIKENPEIDISIDTSDETPEKHPANADVSIRIFKSPPDRYACAPLFPLRLIPAGTVDLYDSITVKAGTVATQFSLIAHTSRPNAWRDWQRSSRIRLLGHKTALRLDSMIAVMRAAERGLGGALVPKQLSDAWLNPGSLVQLFDHELVTDDSYYLVHRREDNENEDIQAFRAWVLQNFVDSS